MLDWCIIVMKKLSQSCIEAANAMQIRYHVGTIASQDLFMSRDEDFEKLMNNFPDSICSEMEAGAIGAVLPHSLIFHL